MHIISDYFVCIRYDTNDVNSRKIITYVIGENEKECFINGKTWKKSGGGWICE